MVPHHQSQHLLVVLSHSLRTLFFQNFVVSVMAFTMHSHSGQFCPGHAQDELEHIIQHAISVGYKTIGLTEHMPRYEERDLYPDEVR
jgi:hypothetical protein